MNLKRRVLTVGAGLVIAGAGALAAAPVASALAVTPAPGGAHVHLNSGEARVLHDAQIGDAVNQVVPQRDDRYGQQLGTFIDTWSGYAATSPTGHFWVGVTGLPEGTWHVGYNR